MQTEDQAGRLRRLMRQVRQTRTIAVTSGKGGVGKSNIALNLAVLLSAAGNRVALVDADLGLANLDLLVDVDVRGNLSHVIAGTRRLGEVVIDLPSADVAQELIEGVRDEFREAEKELIDGLTVRIADWWFNLRQPGKSAELRLNVEARSDRDLRRGRQTVERLVARLLGAAGR